jgi:hypothetical protein
MIDNVTVVSNDGLHGVVSSPDHRLKAGKHAITVCSSREGAVHCLR